VESYCSSNRKNSNNLTESAPRFAEFKKVLEKNW